ncbi:MAG: hypothetical protein C5B53_02275 [Candidatus Melainabacteria bacterium]|nr:MAG: hypothetical protein C5B53_02275 [Candidatus Melainabacteria bacterium]
MNSYVERTNAGTLRILAIVGLACIFSSATPANAETFCQRHPRRAEVLRRDAALNRALNRDYGHLDGHFGQLKREDRLIRRQEQLDARLNGGHITRAEQGQLNREENHLRHQINRDLNR